MAKGIPVDTDPDPSPNPGATKLRQYWVHGEGAKKIRWGTPGDFSRCVRHLREHVGAGAEGLCNVFHTSATGHPPGKGHKALIKIDDGTGLVVHLPSNVSTADIFEVGNSFKMLGIDAVPYSAEMINLKSIGDIPDEYFVGSSMSHGSAIGIPDFDKSVTFLVKGASPQPTITRPVGEVHNSVSDAWLSLAQRLEVNPASLLVPVSATKTLGQMRFIASIESAVHTLHSTPNRLFTPSIRASDAVKALLDELETKASPAGTMRAMDSGVSAGARNRAMNESRARMNRNDANARANAQKKNKTKQRRIRTQAGARRYKGNIGDVITTKKVEKGDTLWDLAKAQYGDPNKWKLIAEANDIKDPKKLPIGKELVFPPDPSNPKGNAQGTSKGGSSSATSRNATGKGKAKTAGEQRAEDARKDHSTYSDSDSVDLEATYYAPKNMAIEDVLRKFYGNTDRLDDVLKVNGLDRGDEILAGQSLILPGIDPSEIYPDKKKRDSAKKTADAKRQGKVPEASPGGAKAKATARGYTLFADGSIYGAGGWIVNATKKKADARREAKKRK